MSPLRNKGTVRVALAKGRMFDDVVSLLSAAGIQITQSERGYRPNISLPNFSAKILKPRNVISMLLANARDIGFAGDDWVRETDADLVQLIDTRLNPVRLVVAAPQQILNDGKLPDRELVVATEYPNIARNWIEKNQLNAKILTTYGATEVFPPEDCALALGAAIDQALGPRKGIVRFGYAYAPLDEALARTVIDLSGRPWPNIELKLRREMVGALATENVTHFFVSLAMSLKCSLHVDVLRGQNDHHQAEAAFKSLALALRNAIRRTAGDVPSTKGILA